jgi:hypothetical protein
MSIVPSAYQAMSTDTRADTKRRSTSLPSNGGELEIDSTRKVKGVTVSSRHREDVELVTWTDCDLSRMRWQRKPLTRQPCFHVGKTLPATCIVAYGLYNVGNSMLACLCGAPTSHGQKSQVLLDRRAADAWMASAV